MVTHTTFYPRIAFHAFVAFPTLTVKLNKLKKNKKRLTSSGMQTFNKEIKWANKLSYTDLNANNVMLYKHANG